MPTPAAATEPRRRSLAALRGVGFAAAVILGAVAIWLIVTSTSQKRIEIGVLTGLWGLLLGAYSVFGSRSHHREAAAATGQEVDLRAGAELQRAAVVAAVAAARREFQAELEELLRREVRAGLAQELAGLRAEVTALRNELVEKVGGQLRLERIETTRLIGSDLEALQHELRQLREIGGNREADADVVDDRSTRPAAPADVHDAEIVVERVIPLAAAAPAAPEPVVAEPVEPEPEPEPEPVVAATPEPEPAAAPEPVAAAPQPSADPFASMPRIRPFTDFELDPIPTPAVASNGDDAPSRSGRHSTGDGPPNRGGRRHRADGDDGNDVLARILARESRS